MNWESEKGVRRESEDAGRGGAGKGHDEELK